MRNGFLTLSVGGSTPDRLTTIGITSMERVGDTQKVVVTTDGDHNLQNGTRVYISGAKEDEFNTPKGEAAIVTDTDTFVIRVPGSSAEATTDDAISLTCEMWRKKKVELNVQGGPMLDNLHGTKLYLPADGTGGADVVVTPSDKAGNLGLFVYQADDNDITDLVINHVSAKQGYDFESMNQLLSLSFPLLTTLEASSYFYLRICPLLASLLFPALKVIGGNFNVITCDSLTELNFPELTTCHGMSFAGAALLEQILLPSLGTATDGAVEVSNCPSLTTLSVPLLETCGAFIFQPAGSVHPSLSLPALTTINTGGQISISAVSALSIPLLETCNALTIEATNLTTIDSTVLASLTTCTALTFQNNTLLTTVNLPLLVAATGGITIKSNVLLTTLTLANYVATAGVNYDFTGNSLNAASVNAILAFLIATPTWGTTGETVLLNGGTNAQPTGQGLTDAAALVTRGATVTTN